MEQNPKVKIHLNFGGSNVLNQQIVERFAVDLFLTAHRSQYDDLSELELIEKEEQFAQNQVVLVSSSESIQSIYDLANEGVSLIFANESVPIGIYTELIIDKVEVNHPGFKAAVKENVLTKAENVAQDLLRIMLGEGAFVYRTDITESVQDSVTVIELEERYQVISELYLALLTKETIKEAAYDFILSSAGQEVLANHGFQ